MFNFDLLKIHKFYLAKDFLKMILVLKNYFIPQYLYEHEVP